MIQVKVWSIQQIYEEGDFYELWMGGVPNSGINCNTPTTTVHGYERTWQDALAQGGLINVVGKQSPLRYLMYSTNQIADHFGSLSDNAVPQVDPQRWYPGDNNYSANYGSDYYSELVQEMNSLGPAVTNISDFPASKEVTSSTAYTFGIRAIAGLLYWFARETGMLSSYVFVPYDYPTISVGLAAASAGKTVVVSPGTYTISSNVSVPSGVTLLLNGGVSLLFGSGSPRILVYGNLVANGATSAHVIVNGQNYSRSGLLNAPIIVPAGGTASLQYTDFQNAPYLFTAYTNAGNVSIQHSSFANFGTSSDAKAITAASIAGTMTISSNTITGSNQGTGIYSSSNGTKVSITGNTITNCGTGIRAYTSNASITGNTIRNNVNYGILADNVTCSAEYSGNDLRGNGYGMFLNSAAPMIHHNTIIQNGCNVYMSSSSPVFGEPGEIHGHNVIAMAASPLVSAQNSSSPCLGYAQGTAGRNSLYETDYPHASAQNYSIVYAQYNYWGGGPGSCYADGTSLFLGEYPLGSDPNPYPQLKPAIAQTSSTVLPEVSARTAEDEQFKEALLRAIAAGQGGSLSQARDSLAWLITNKSNSAFAPLGILAYGDFSGLKGNVVDAKNTVTLESGFQSRLAALRDMPQANPLRPFAVRFLARGAALAHDVKTASVYSEQLVQEYPGTVHELVSLYDLLVSAIEIDEDYAKAQTYLEVLKKKYPGNDLTISASILCGEKVLPGPRKESEAMAAVVLENELDAAYPNPFNPETSIAFSLKQDAHVRLTVFDVLGREVARLADGTRAAGKHSVVWNARSVTSGVYFARLEIHDDAGNRVYGNTAKLMLTK